jgi:tRNA(adenine34) deaminase
MYVTLEPCQMCAGAIVQARIPKVVMGTMNAKAGCAGSVINILQMDRFNHQVEIVKGVLGDECKEMMQEFFKKLRESKK